jgi:hypothetical protein
LFGPYGRDGLNFRIALVACGSHYAAYNNAAGLISIPLEKECF